tara:strand:- start:1547 stop:2065 length:519 start_codon:yes stop_codon:yes gene_type:complete
MSNIGKRKIDIPEGVSVNIKLNDIFIEGKLGLITLNLSKGVDVEKNESQIFVKSKIKSLWGTERTRINNAILGVSQGFQKSLKLVGIGYRAQLNDKILSLKLGFSHEVSYILPQGVDAICPKPDHIVLFGTQKDFLCKVASEIRSIKSPDSYKGKGLRFEDEVLILKEGKKK